MYDCQLFYWPMKNAMVSLDLYIDGSFKLSTEDLDQEEMDKLIDECDEAISEPEDFLLLKGFILLDHIPVNIN